MLFLCALCTVLATAVADIAQNNSYKHVRQVPYANLPAAATQYLPQSSAAVQRTSAPTPLYAAGPVTAAAHRHPAAPLRAPVASAANLQHVQQLIAASATQYTAAAPVPQQKHSPGPVVQRPAAAPARPSTGAGAAQSAAPAPQRPTLATPPPFVADFPLYSEYFEPSDQYLPKGQ